MVNFPVKAIVALGSAGVIGLGGYGIYSAAYKGPVKTIDQLIKEDSKIILLSMDENVDQNQWESNASVLAEDDEEAKLIGFVKSEKTSEEEKKAENVANLKKICKSLLEADSKEGNKLEKFKKWCAKPKVDP